MRKIVSEDLAKVSDTQFNGEPQDGYFVRIVRKSGNKYLSEQGKTSKVHSV